MPPVFGNVVLLRAEGAPFIRPVAFPALQGTRLEELPCAVDVDVWGA